MAAIEHPTMTHLTLVMYYMHPYDWDFKEYSDVYAGLPLLRYPHLEFNYCRLTDADMVDYHYVYKSLAGRFIPD